MSPQSQFLHEVDIHRLAARAGLKPPRHGWLGAELPFMAGEPVVLKGLAHGLWHKSELGALGFMAFDADALRAAADRMRSRVEAAGHGWIGGLVCERVAIARSEGLPSEAFVSLAKRAGIWTLVLGLGGLQVEALGELAPPLCWPMPWVTPDHAYDELVAHTLGRIWLGTMRGTRALTNEAELRRFIAGLWALAAIAEDEGLTLVEMNPVALDASGQPRPLDGVGQRGATPEAQRQPPPAFLHGLLAPRRVAVAGVSSKADNVGHIVVDNLRRAELPAGGLTIIKPGEAELLGLPCVPDVAALLSAPVDLLLIALPAMAAVEMLEGLIAQGGGATVVGLVAGGIGDGADSSGLAARVRTDLDRARRDGRWTPAVLGPNFLGHVVPSAHLNTTFIPADRWSAPAQTGPLALVSQSGAFMLSRLARAPELALSLGLALGNQLDVSLAHVLAGLVAHAEIRAVAAYVEGFGPGELEASAYAASALVHAGKTVVLYRAGRSEAGQVAAASHTGAVAGDLVLEEAVLRRVGVRLAPSITAFDAALSWLGCYPGLEAGAVAVVSNAGFETVNGADRLGGPFGAANLTPAEVDALSALLARHGLASLVSPRLPLDLTPMATLEVYRDAVELVLDGHADIAIVGLVPFTRRLDFTQPLELARALRGAADARGKALALVLDAGPDHDVLRGELARGGLPVFLRMEDAIAGLRVLA